MKTYDVLDGSSNATRRTSYERLIFSRSKSKHLLQVSHVQVPLVSPKSRSAVLDSHQSVHFECLTLILISIVTNYYDSHKPSLHAQDFPQGLRSSHPLILRPYTCTLQGIGFESLLTLFLFQAQSVSYLLCFLKPRSTCIQLIQSLDSNTYYIDSISTWVCMSSFHLKSNSLSTNSTNSVCHLEFRSSSRSKVAFTCSTCLIHLFIPFPQVQVA